MKNLTALLNLFSLLFVFSLTISAQETKSISSSGLAGISLPAGAQRVTPESVPADITQTLDKIVAGGGDKLRKGDTEVLVWAGTNYSKANAKIIINRLTDTLKVAGWNYSVEGSEGGLTVFSLSKKGLNPQVIIGFYGATDDALIFTWMEVLSNGGSDATAVKEKPSNHNAGVSTDSVVGTWTNGNVSTLSEKNLTTGAISSRGGSTFKYVFNADGSFSFVGLINSTMYGCTTSLFNDKRGRYEISGSKITLVPSKNFWRNMYSCSPASNKERDYVLERETYSFRTKTEEYGATLICLAKAGSDEACYRREQ